MPRDDIKQLQEIPNVGPAIEKHFNIIGISSPEQLTGKDAYELYRQLCKITNQKHDPCLIDVFISAVRYMEGGPARKWWEFTKERKNKLGTK